MNSFEISNQIKFNFLHSILINYFDCDIVISHYTAASFHENKCVVICLFFFFLSFFVFCAYIEPLKYYNYEMYYNPFLIAYCGFFYNIIVYNRYNMMCTVYYVFTLLSYKHYKAPRTRLTITNPARCIGVHKHIIYTYHIIIYKCKYIEREWE